ncbi:hypothetical protein [Chlorogloeopsis fritschii]|uniref:hypothetical protein n=1 Tax=Chlorogloeopsis fritschii TaxID=1124 RepID=UPI0023F15E96|nr:hypothetical protein [Chlorogloeopsis fritschii]
MLEKIERLNKLSQICFIPLTPETMRKAAELWAWVRNQGNRLQAITSFLLLLWRNF